EREYEYGLDELGRPEDRAARYPGELGREKRRAVVVAGGLVGIEGMADGKVPFEDGGGVEPVLAEVVRLELGDGARCKSDRDRDGERRRRGSDARRNARRRLQRAAAKREQRDGLQRKSGGE